MEEAQALPQLNRRQLQFLALKARGYTDQQIAAECSCARKTVSNTLDSARSRLNARNVVQAVLIAIALEVLILTGDGDVVIPEQVNHMSALSAPMGNPNGWTQVNSLARAAA